MKYLYKLCVFLLIGLVNVSYAVEHYTKQWTGSTIIGSFPQNNKFKYYIEPQLRLIDNEYVFNQALLFLGLGYEPIRPVMFFMGPAFVEGKTNTGETYQEYRLWQQINWQVAENPIIIVNSRTRMEEKERSNAPGIALQLRQRMWVRVPFKNLKKYYFSTYDEVFFNFNHPEWTSLYFFEQNRAFIGIGKELAPNILLDVGYLNQIQFGPPKQISNIFLVSISVNVLM